MIQVTKQFIKNEDINIENIKRRLEQVTDAIRKSNQIFRNYMINIGNLFGK